MQNLRERVLGDGQVFIVIGYPLRPQPGPEEPIFIFFGNLESQIQIESAAKPEIVTAFQEISQAARAHNLALIAQYDRGQPGNGPAYSAGINKLHAAGRKHGGSTLL